MPEEKIDLIPCPFCGAIPSITSAGFDASDDDYFVCCSACGCVLSGFRSVDEAEQFWNERFITDQMVADMFQMKIQSTPQENKMLNFFDGITSFLRSGKFFFWLSCVFFSLTAYFSPSAADYPTGLSGVFSIFGFYCLFYGFFRYCENS